MRAKDRWDMVKELKPIEPQLVCDVCGAQAVQWRLIVKGTATRCDKHRLSDKQTKEL